MAVFRVERSTNYTVMSNYHLRDKSISLKAKGLLSQMLSLPEDWDYTLAGLARINAEGKDAVRAAVRELEDAGYVTRSRVRDERGCLRGTEYVIHEMPVSDKPTQENSAFSCEPTLEEPVEEKPTLEKTTQLNKDINKITDSQSKESIRFDSDSKARRGKPIRVEEMNAYRALICDNIEYDILVQNRPTDREKVNELVEIMTETVCSNRRTLRVSGSDMPQEVVKSRLLKLTYGHIEYVLDCLAENTTRVRNVRQYLLAVLYNAPVTIENGYAARVRWDAREEYEPWRICS